VRRSVSRALLESSPDDIIVAPQGVPKSTVTIATAENYAGIVSQRVDAERLSLASQWLHRLKELLVVPPNDVFPSDRLLDHIPALIAEIAGYLRAPADEEIAANAAVIDKARELGILRHEQQASVHQLLREYEILGDILETFIVAETARLGLQPSPAECFEVSRRLTRSVRTLLRTTVDTFVSEYTAAIQERNERIKSFNRMASHELRSPIGTLLFAAAVLKKDAIRANPDRVAKIAMTMHDNAERLSWLVQNLQRMTQLSELTDVPSEQRVELAALAADVARQLGDMAASRGVAIRIGRDLPVLIADPARLELVFLNLVSNAIKYSDPGEPDPFVEIASAVRPSVQDDTAAATFTICVRDNGLGIPEADQPAIFERFFRGHAHLDGELGVTGTGLGLAIVAECIHALGGSIRCESAIGHGTTFLVTLPRGGDRSSATP
jgi:signal transduction histidine kinase